jgi:DNA-binding MarR family transcriptional regulator
MTSSEHSANVLGALALRLHDRMSAAVAEAAGEPESGATTLSWLANFAAQPQVGLLNRMLGLTPSGAVRMVDRLEADGHLRRGPGPDGRSTTVRLTTRGRRTAQRVAGARLAVLTDALSVLSDEERETLDRLVGKVLVGLKRDAATSRAASARGSAVAGGFMCRLCDTTACGHAEGRCPVYQR